MEVKKAEFISSFADYKDCSKEDIPEVAFIGRSNVGKSSLINLLTNNNKLAKISSTPGKTQTINHFKIDDRWHIVDLPGYGWAKVSKTEKAKWHKMVSDYLMNREQLQTIFVLIDSRLPPQAIDLEFIQWIGENEVPFSIVFTKVDKQTRNKTGTAIAQFSKELYKTWVELPPIFVSSASSGVGKDDILGYIYEVNEAFFTHKKNLS